MKQNSSPLWSFHQLRLQTWTPEESQNPGLFRLEEGGWWFDSWVSLKLLSKHFSVSELKPLYCSASSVYGGEAAALSSPPVYPERICSDRTEPGPNPVYDYRFSPVSLFLIFSINHKYVFFSQTCKNVWIKTHKASNRANVG